MPYPQLPGINELRPSGREQHLTLLLAKSGKQCRGPVSIELARYVVQEKYRPDPSRAGHDIDLGKLHRQDDPAMLPLRCDATGTSTVESYRQIVAVRTDAS